VTALALALGVAIAVAAVLIVALPFLREPQAGDDRLDVPNAADDERRGLIEARDRALAALKELEFDHRTGKIGEDDYAELVGPLRQAAAAALRALDREPRYGSRIVDTTALQPPEPVPEPYPPPDEGSPPRLPVVPDQDPEE